MSNSLDKIALMEACAIERDTAASWFRLPVEFDLDTALCIIGSLQLSLRHPANRGAAAQAARIMVDGMIARLREDGLVAYADLAALGDDPNYDEIQRA